jgi:hypothetical protein
MSVIATSLRKVHRLYGTYRPFSGLEVGNLLVLELSIYLLLLRLAWWEPYIWVEVLGASSKAKTTARAGLVD